MVFRGPKTFTVAGKIQLQKVQIMIEFRLFSNHYCCFVFVPANDLVGFSPPPLPLIASVTAAVALVVPIAMEMSPAAPFVALAQAKRTQQTTYPPTYLPIRVRARHFTLLRVERHTRTATKTATFLGPDDRLCRHCRPKPLLLWSVYL